MKALYIN